MHTDHFPRQQTEEELKLVNKRSYGCYKRTAAKPVRTLEKKRKPRKNKPYQRAAYPGQKNQMDVKYVPSECVVNGEKYYQFTAKDECTRWTYREYHRSRIATPRHNGKVERQHRTDELRFYKHMRMYSLADGRKQLAVYQRQSNNHIMTCLGMKSPNQVLSLFHGVMWENNRQPRVVDQVRPTTLLL